MVTEGEPSDPGGSSGRGGAGPSGSGGGGGSSSVGGTGAIGGTGATGGAGAMGGAGAIGGTDSVGGTGAIGGAGAIGGSGATGGSVNVPPCTDPDHFEPDFGVDVATPVTGINGTYTDRCDADGNLIEYQCEMVECFFPLEAAAPTPPADGGASGIGMCAPNVPTGNVTQVAVDCHGRCDQGACPVFCPDVSDFFEVTHAVPGVALIAIHEDGQYVSCHSLFADDVPCTSESLVGERMSVLSLEACSPASFVIEAIAALCMYECEIAVPPPEAD